MTTITAKDVADYILLAMRKRGECLTNLKLQKLVYYSQAWFVTKYGSPMFSEQVEAWVHGPVVPSLFQQFRDFRWTPIDCEILPPTLPSEVSSHIDRVLDAYAHLDATQLERLIHRESPWLEARGGIPHDEPSRAVISTETMGKFYLALHAATRQ